MATRAAPNGTRGGMLSQADLEFIALNSDIENEFDLQSSPSSDSTSSQDFRPRRRSYLSGKAITAGIALLAIFALALVVFQDKPVSSEMSQIKGTAIEGKATQAWETSPHAEPLLSAALVEAKSSDVSSSGSTSSSSEAWAAAARVSEAAAASWDLNALPCRCGCPDGSPALPPRGQIVQSASDSRKHRAVTLPGGLKAFLTSDPATDFAAAAVDVGVGSASDPKDMPGLAHFLEHMLFMGSEKYPKEDEYSKFLTQNGGYDNAFTANEHTNFFFKVRAAVLPQALDRFAQFFASPLLKESSASREVKAVDAEHHKNLNNDQWRIMQVQVSECGGRPDHFGTGDRHTLRDGSKETVEALRKFHSQNYVADNLRLSVLGKESLDDLEKFARSAFEHVRRGSAPAKDLSPLPGPPEGVCAGGNAYIVRPLGELQSLTLAFPAREMRSEQAQRSAALSILSFVLGGKHEGSLYADLKKRGWATGVSFGVGVNMPDSSTLELQVELTTPGMAAIPDVVDMALGHLKLVVEALQAYAHSLKHHSTSENEADSKRRMQGGGGSKVCGLWSDIEAIAALNFHFQENSDPADFVSGVAADLHTLPPRDVLGSSVSTQMDAEVALSIVEALDNRHKLPSLWVYSKDFDGGDSLREALRETTEPIYGTTYSKGEFPSTLVSRWLGDHAPQPPKDAQLPRKLAKFLPDRLVLQPVPADGAGRRQAAPAELSVSKHGKLFHKPDAEYRVPKASVRCLAATPAVYEESASAAQEAHMLSTAVTDALEVSLYRASLAGYSWGISVTPSGFELSVAGYGGHGLETLAQSLAAALAEPPALARGRFKALLSLHHRAISSSRHEDLYALGRTYLSGQALQTPVWSWAEQLAAAEDVTWEAAVKRGKLIRSASALTCFAHGDVSKAGAQRIATHLAPALSIRSLPLKKAPLPGITALPKQSDFTEMRSPALVDDESNSLVILVYQLEPEVCQGENKVCRAAMKQAAAMLLLQEVISQKAFNQLRTKETLGYVVWAWVQPSAVENAGGRVVWSLRLLVQSGVKSATYVRERMTSFMDGFLKQMEAGHEKPSEGEAVITDADIELAKQGLTASLLKRPESLAKEGTRIWTEVVLRRDDWARPWELAEVVPTLSRKDATEVLRHVMQPGQPGRRAAIEVWRSQDDGVFSHSPSALHLDDAAAMRRWKEKTGTWSSEL